MWVYGYQKIFGTLCIFKRSFLEMKNLPKTTFCSDRVPNIGYLDFRNKFKYNKIPGRIK